MTRDIKDKIEIEIVALQNLDVKACLFMAYPQKTIGEIVISRFNGESFLFYIEKIIENFSQQFAGSDWQFWFTSCFNPQRQSLEIVSALSNLRTNISNRQFQVAESFLWAIVNYQITNSFWNEKNTNAIKQTKLKEMFSNLDARKEEYDMRISTLMQKLSKIEEDMSLKAARLDEIEEKEASLDAILTSAQEINNKYANVNGEIAAQKESNEKVISDLQQALREATTLKQTIDEDYNNIALLEKKANNTYNNIANKAKESEDLVGKISDNSLGYSFSVRKDELLKTVRSWKYLLVPLYFILAGGWFFISYKFIDINVENEFAKILVFTGKLSLSLYIIYFALREYVKERKLWEEYSFKTAVALTINAYGDQIGQAKHCSDGDENIHETLDYKRRKETNRQDFIKATVDTLYEVPKYSDKFENNLLKNGISDTANKVKEIVGNIADNSKE